MCGIVGYTGERPVVPLLLEGLARLEYRGYDSAGLAVPENGGIVVEKKKGRLADLCEHLNGREFSATTGIGHTRWATHGRPCDKNAHPHTDCSGRFAVLHNGIIENFLPLREWLEERGHVFKSETDTEVLPHLIEEYYRGDLLEAVRATLDRVDGSYALVALASPEPGRIVAARQDSPLVVGLGRGENFLASDIPAFLDYTRETYIIGDGELVDLSPSGVRVVDRQGREVEKKVFHVSWRADQARKDGYPHFMLKEIHEQPRAIRDTLAGRLDAATGRINLGLSSLRTGGRIFISACGTAYHAGLVGKYLIERLARIPVEADIASEFRYRRPLLQQGDLLVVISQSGETADTLAALREARRQGAQVLAVSNVVDSSVAREADQVVYTWAGPEIAVASTKAYVTQLTVLTMLALHLASVRGSLTEGERTELLAELARLPQAAQAILADTQAVEELAARFAQTEDLFFIGRGLDYAVAMEGSLKLKEISYIHAEAYAAGEMKHGTLALVTEGVPVIALATQPELLEKMISNIKEVKAREATTIGVAMEGNREMARVVDHTLYIPAIHPLLAPALAVIPLQLFAYYVAVARGCDVDKPRNLAKSVTVE